jgi:diguanylate cyclase (GGDEF)-like protein
MTNKVPLHNQDGKIIGIMGTYEDITERKQSENLLKQTNGKLIALVETLEQRNHEANLLREMDDLLQACNVPEEAYTVVQQYGPLLFPSTSGALFLISNSRRSVEAVTSWGEVLQGERVFNPEDCWVLRRGRIHRWNNLVPGLRCNHIPASSIGDFLGIPMLAAGELLGVLHLESSLHSLGNKNVEELAQSITEHLALMLSNIKLREKLQAQSIRDSLTGLFNRRFMEEFLEKELNRAKRKQSTVGVIMLDIDHFKDFNDTNGHDGGDEVLRELGTLLKTKIRDGDIACRYGGEEFFLILPEATIDITQERAELIRNAVRSMVVEFHRKRLGTISVSLGIAVYPDHGKDSVSLFSVVDKALYKAKHNGRDRVEIAS